MLEVMHVMPAFHAVVAVVAVAVAVVAVVAPHLSGQHGVCPLYLGGLLLLLRCS